MKLEIRKIAEKLVREVYNNDVDFMDQVEEVITRLSRNYFIIPKSTVENMYTVAEVVSEVCLEQGITVPDSTKERLKLLPELFGPESFKEKHE